MELSMRSLSAAGLVTNRAWRQSRSAFSRSKQTVADCSLRQRGGWDSAIAWWSSRLAWEMNAAGDRRVELNCAVKGSVSLCV